MKRFVIAAKTSTSSDAIKISDLFRPRFAWWHWIDNVWLVVDKKDQLTPQTIRDMIGVAVPGTHLIVLQVESGGTWSGFGLKTPTKDMFKWIKEHWDKE
jgi:hypothetical protein